MTLDRYDLAVLGAGSGGLAAAQRAARHGARVAVFEPAFLGGTCVNVGCVPKKAMWIASEAAAQIALARDLGFAVADGAFDWKGYVERREAYIERARASYRNRLEQLGIALIPAAARLAPDGRVTSDAGDVVAGHRLIATGTRPRRLHLPGFDFGCVSDDVFALASLPERIAIVGGGYIAAEMAGLLRGLGAQVTLLVRASTLLGHFDPDVAKELTEAMRDRGVDVRCGILVAGLERADDGSVRVLCTNGATIEGFDWLLWAVGRRPNTDDLGLDAAGVATTADGHVEIDERQNSSAPGIYAIGDVGTQPALTPVAIAAGRRLADRLFGDASEASPLAIEPLATVVFSHPPVASCGLTEPQARRQHGEGVRVFTTRFRPMREALAQRDEHVFAKLVCAGAEERVVGLHMIGPGVDEIMQGFAVAMRVGATRRDFNETIPIHPTTAEEISLLGA